MNKKKIAEKSLEHLKNPRTWGQLLTAVFSTLIFLIPTYYELREDVDQSSENLAGKGKDSEQSLVEALKEVKERMQFLYNRTQANHAGVVLLEDRMAELELENKRLSARLERYRAATGVPFGEADLTDLASRLAPLLNLGSMSVGTIGRGAGTGLTPPVLVTEAPLPVDDPSKEKRPQPEGKAADAVTEEGQLKFSEVQKAW